MPTCPHAETSSPLLSLRDASERGYGGYSTLRKYIADGRLPAEHIGRNVRVRLADLEALLTPSPSRTLDQAVEALVTSAPALSPDQVRRLRDALTPREAVA